jgi:hypothetical protein
MKNRVGEKFITNEGYNIKIIEYFGTYNCTIQFDNGNIFKNKRYEDIKRGEVRNPYHKSVHKVGYLGEGKYNCKTHSGAYNCWANMIRRCYSEEYPTYKFCTVSKDWECFQNFAEWFYNNWKPFIDKSWNLDKDVLIKGNKIYSPTTCCFLPKEINILFIKSDKKRGNLPIGVCKIGNKFKAQISNKRKQVYLGIFDTINEAFEAYKTAKEKYIKEVVKKWKPLIEDKVYRALINYKVEITD